MSAYVKYVAAMSAVMLGIIAWHFGTVFGFWGYAPETRAEFFVRLGLIVAGFVIASIISASLLAAHNDKALEPDERERTVTAFSERNGGFVLGAGLIILMWFVFRPLSPMAIANAGLAILAASEIVKLFSGLYYLKRGV